MLVRTIFTVGNHMLTGGSSPVHSPADDESNTQKQSRLGVAISPLALPILAGPGTIATAVGFSAGGSLLSATLPWAALRCCVRSPMCALCGDGCLVSWLGAEAIGALSRIMGSILAVIGVQMAVDGIKQAFSLS